MRWSGVYNNHSYVGRFLLEMKRSTTSIDLRPKMKPIQREFESKRICGVILATGSQKGVSGSLHAPQIFLVYAAKVLERWQGSGPIL